MVLPTITLNQLGVGAIHSEVLCTPEVREETCRLIMIDGPRYRLTAQG
jgi:hypothetical protein